MPVSAAAQVHALEAAAGKWPAAPQPSEQQHALRAPDMETSTSSTLRPSSSAAASPCTDKYASKRLLSWQLALQQTVLEPDGHVSQANPVRDPRLTELLCGSWCCSRLLQLLIYWFLAMQYFHA